ncbi:hypothetical protein EG329_004804 [Mollisiaceae sp. DMI_Dod_QoI]|nr:hypothetical protein EG329_004804 [Helotiales sp. DMI_Dod_QoI]
MSEYNVPPELLPYLLHEKEDNSAVQQSIININAVFLALIWVTTGLRFWVRFRMLRSAGLDDILTIIALIFATFLSISSLVGESFGLGKHEWNLSSDLSSLPSVTSQITKALYGSYLAYSTAITFTKFSIMATYVRIFPRGALRKTVYGTAILVLCFWIASVFAIIFMCVPVQAAWDYNVKGRCFPIVNFFYASSAFNIATDVLLCFLPVPTLWALNMPKPQRAVIICLFSMGTFACVASILRLTQLHRLSGVDLTYQAVSSLNWSVVEVDMGIICASLSALRPLAKRFIPNLFPQATGFSSPIDRASHSSTTTQANNSTSRFLSPPGKIMSFKAIMSPNPSGRRGRSRSVASSRSEIYIQKTFEVETMKELPDLPDAYHARSRTSNSEDAIQVQISRRMSSIGEGKGKENDIETEVEVEMEEQALKWPTRTLAKGKHERGASRSRPSVVGVFTAELLDLTSSEDVSVATRRSSRDSEETILEMMMGESSSG